MYSTLVNNLRIEWEIYIISTYLIKTLENS